MAIKGLCRDYHSVANRLPLWLGKGSRSDPRVLSYDVSAMLLVEDVADRHEFATLIGA